LGNLYLSFFGTCPGEDRRLNEKEAEFARSLFLEPLGRFDFRGSVENQLPFSLSYWALGFYPFYLCVLCALCG